MYQPVQPLRPRPARQDGPTVPSMSSTRSFLRARVTEGCLPWADLPAPYQPRAARAAQGGDWSRRRVVRGRSVCGRPNPNRLAEAAVARTGTAKSDCQVKARSRNRTPPVQASAPRCSWIEVTTASTAVTPQVASSGDPAEVLAEAITRGVVRKEAGRLRESSADSPRPWRRSR